MNPLSTAPSTSSPRIFKEQPLVSVIIPTWNGALFILETLKSVLAQTHRSIEVIVVDDGSTDGTSAIIEAVDGPIRLLRQQNAGTAAARNTGLAAARGEWVAFLDHDDLWVHDKVEQQLAAMCERTGYSGVYSAFDFFDGASRNITATHFPPAGVDFHDLLGFEIISLQSLLCRTDLARAIGGFDATLNGTDDWDFAIRLARHQPLTGIERVLVHIRLHKAQAGRQRASMFENSCRVLAKHSQEHGKCDQCLTAIRQSRRRINAFYYEHLREEIVGGLRSAELLRLSQAVFNAVTRTPEQILATSSRKITRLLTAVSGTAKSKP